MAVQTVLESTKLRMVDNYGVVDGKTVTKNHTYSKVRATADDSEIYDLARAIDSLTTPTTDEVYAVRTTAITSEG